MGCSGSVGEWMRYLVTGGAGFIGSNTVDELVRRGHDVVVLDDLSTGKAENLAQARSKIELIQDSITNLDALREACRGVDCVIHLAAQTSVPRSVKDPIETNLINVNGTLNVLVAARDAKVKRVVFACSCAVYGKTSVLPIRESASLAPISPYGVSKQVGEAYGRVFQEMYGLEFVSLRYFNVFGPRQDPSSPYSGVLSVFSAALLGERNPPCTATASNRATLSTWKTWWKRICSPPRQRARPASPSTSARETAAR